MTDLMNCFDFSGLISGIGASILLFINYFIVCLIFGGIWMVMGVVCESKFKMSEKQAFRFQASLLVVCGLLTFAVLALYYSGVISIIPFRISR